MTDDDYKLMAEKVRHLRRDARETIKLGEYHPSSEGWVYHSGRIAAFTEILAYLSPNPHDG